MSQLRAVLDAAAASLDGFPAVWLVERMRPHLLSALPGTTEGKHFIAGLLAAQLGVLNEQTKVCGKRSETSCIHPDAPTLLSFPGFGPYRGQGKPVACAA